MTAILSGKMRMEDCLFISARWCTKRSKRCGHLPPRANHVEEPFVIGTTRSSWATQPARPGGSRTCCTRREVFPDGRNRAVDVETDVTCGCHVTDEGEGIAPEFLPRVFGHLCKPMARRRAATEASARSGAGQEFCGVARRHGHGRKRGPRPWQSFHSSTSAQGSRRSFASHRQTNYRSISKTGRRSHSDRRRR